MVTVYRGGATSSHWYEVKEAELDPDRNAYLATYNVMLGQATKTTHVQFVLHLNDLDDILEHILQPVKWGGHETARAKEIIIQQLAKMIRLSNDPEKELAQHLEGLTKAIGLSVQIPKPTHELPKEYM